MRVALRASAIVTMLLAVPSIGASQSVPIDLGTLGGLYSSAAAVNASGQVVGQSWTADGFVHPFSWTETGGMVDLGTLGGTTGFAVAVNSEGQVVGSSQRSGGSTHAFVWTAADGMFDLGTLGGTFSSATALNEDGMVVGFSGTTDGSFHAFVWTAADGMFDLDTLGGTSSNATALNKDGMVVGSSSTTGGETHAFVWTAAGGMVDLGTLGGTFSRAAGVNDSGQVVGTSFLPGNVDQHAFLWSAADGMADLGTLGGRQSSVGAPGSGAGRPLNAGGQVVGQSSVSVTEAQHAFLWTLSGGMLDLGTLGAAAFSSAKAVNDQGQVVGTSFGPSRAFSWTEHGGLIDLGTLGGSYSGADDLNDSGQVVGTSALPGDVESHAVLWNTNDPLALLQQLIERVTRLDFTQGARDSLLAHLSTAAARLESRSSADDMAAIGALQAFINHLFGVPVFVDNGGQPIPGAETDALREAAQHIIDVLSS